MDALVMAGGAATRMGGAEKPIVQLAGRPMIAYVIEALLESRSVGHVYVAVSPRVPLTAEYLRTAYCSGGRVSLVPTPGAGYVEDAALAADRAGLRRPFLIISADIPLVTPEVVDGAIGRYETGGAEALSVRLHPAHAPPWLAPAMVLEEGGARTVPVGINIVDGRHMDRYQEEIVYLVEDGRLAINVNYERDLVECERILARERAHR